MTYGMPLMVVVNILERRATGSRSSARESEDSRRMSVVWRRRGLDLMEADMDLCVMINYEKGEVEKKVRRVREKIKQLIKFINYMFLHVSVHNKINT